MIRSIEQQASLMALHWPGFEGIALRYQFPRVRVITPRLAPNTKAAEEAPLPHVYLDDRDIPNSPLCLFDPDQNEWSHDDYLALTTVKWSADWLACYEIWQVTGRWRGGGRHQSGVMRRAA